MNRLIKALVIGSLTLIGATAAQAAPKKPAGEVSVTLANASASALVDFSLIETVPAPAPAAKSHDWWAAPLDWFSPNSAAAAPVTRTVNLLKSPLAPKKSVSVKIGKECKATVSAKFEDGSSVEPVEMDFCKDRKVTLKGASTVEE